MAGNKVWRAHGRRRACHAVSRTILRDGQPEKAIDTSFINSMKGERMYAEQNVACTGPNQYKDMIVTNSLPDIIVDGVTNLRDLVGGQPDRIREKRRQMGYRLVPRVRGESQSGSRRVRQRHGASMILMAFSDMIGRSPAGGGRTGPQDVPVPPSGETGTVRQCSFALLIYQASPVRLILTLS